MKLRTRFILLVIVLYIFVGGISACTFLSTSDSIILSFVERFARKETLFQRSRIQGIVERELTLTHRMADDDLIRSWILHETDPAARKSAFNQIHGYQRLFHDGEAFLASNLSFNYYTFLKENLETPRIRMNKENPADRWFFRARASRELYEMHLDYDPYREATKIWINHQVRDGSSRVIAILGTGIDITYFIDETVNKPEDGVSVVIMDRQGRIQSCEDRSIVAKNASIYDLNRRITYRDYEKTIPIIDQITYGMKFLRKPGAPDTYTFVWDSPRSGGRKIVSMSFFPAPGWYNIVTVDATKILNTHAFLPVIAIGVISIILMLVLLTLILNRLILQPLEELTGASALVAGGNYDTRIPVNRSDEIGVLTDSFNSMTSTIRDHINELESRVARRTRDLSDANANLIKSNNSILESIRYAAIIQNSILPDAELFQECFEESFVIHRPMDIVGGDFHLLRKMNNVIVLAVLDCTGHGVPGAFMTMSASSALNHILDSGTFTSPAEILGRLNRSMKEAIQFREIDAGLDAAICVVDPESESILFSGAGLSLYHTADGTIQEIKGDPQRIGYRTSSANHVFRESSISLKENSRFYMLSDGILDLPGGPKGFAFGSARFINWLESNWSLPMEDQKRLIEKTLGEYQGDRDPRDDISLVGFRVRHGIERSSGESH